VIEEGAPQLEAYRKKRDPDRTPEPFGGRRLTPGQGFVVQKHAARRLHYDLRLEMDGVLKSWAVPKGPSVHAEEKRLAVHVEDHPVEYADFEGVIAHGNYGAGSVIVWDRGWYRLVKPEDPLEQLRRGKLEFELFGYKLRGRWTLARMSGKDKDWLLLKKLDGAAASEELTERYPQSVLSGLTVEEMADTPGRLAAIRQRLEGLGAPRREVTVRRQPFMLATLGERVPSGKDWLYEIKFDGVRVLAARRGALVELYGRSGQVITGRYPDLVRTLLALRVDHFVIDGEIVALDPGGRPSFQRLQPRMALTDPREIESAAARIPVEGAFFDCVELEGHDLRRLPLTQRKECLRMLVPPLGPVHYVDHVMEHGDAFLEAAAEARLEGIVAKRASSAYTGGRSRDWIKVKCQRRGEFVIGGYTDPQGARGYFGALHIGLYDGTRLVYVSKVGTGFDHERLKSLWEELRPLARATPPFDGGTIPTGRGHHWVEPQLVCEVRFSDWTDDGGIRHPTFLRLRSDTRPEDCRREESRLPSRDDAPEEIAAPAVPASPAGGESVAKEVKLTNLKKLFWPAEGYTKGDLVAYYEQVAPLLLPYLRDRPLVLTRYPDGITGKSFYQKDAPEFAPAWVRTERVADGLARAAGLAGAGPGPQGRALHRRGEGGPGPPPYPRRSRAAELSEDVGGHRSPHPDPPRGPLRRRRGAHVRAPARRARRGGGAGHLHGGQTSARPGREGVHRLRPEWPRPDDRGPVFLAAAARRARVLPAPLERGDGPSRSGALHHGHRPQALRGDGRSYPSRPGWRNRHGCGPRPHGEAIRRRGRGQGRNDQGFKNAWS
jgi:bifunctional non-homologous end joining protein LigD